MYQTINGLESDALRFHSHSARENIHFWNGLFNINNEGLVDWISYIIFIQPVAWRRIAHNVHMAADHQQDKP